MSRTASTWADLVGAGNYRLETGELGVRVVDRREDWALCERSRKRTGDVGDDPAHPELSARNAAVVEGAALRRLAVLFSGGGSTLANLIDATRDGRLPGHAVVRAVSSRRGVAGIDRCAAAGVPCAVVAKKDYSTPAGHSAAVLAAIGEEADLICLAGWMNQLVLPPRWLGGRVLNVHPSLLPKIRRPRHVRPPRPRGGPRRRRDARPAAPSTPSTTRSTAGRSWPGRRSRCSPATPSRPSPPACRRRSGSCTRG